MDDRRTGSQFFLRKPLDDHVTRIRGLPSASEFHRLWKSIWLQRPSIRQRFRADMQYGREGCISQIQIAWQLAVNARPDPRQ